MKHARAVTQVDRYIAVAALRGVAQVAAGLTALFSLFAFVDQLGYVGQGHYRLLDALTYVLLTAPTKLLQVIPVSMLLGTLMSLGALARHSELTALGSHGVSERRILGAVLKLAVPVTVAAFLLAQFVIPPAQQRADQGRDAALSATAAPGNDSFWAQGNRQYLNVRQFAYGNAQNDIDIYSFAPDGTLQNYIHAAHADIRTDGIWRLTDVTQKQITAAQMQTVHLDTLDWHPFLSRQEIQLLLLPPESMPPLALYRYLHGLKQSHGQAIRYEQALWSKLSIPFSMIAMILIAAPFIFGPPRAQNAGQQITLGAIIGIVFSLAQQIAGYLDLLLDLNPAAAALTPSLLLIALAIYLFRRAHRG